MDINSLNSLKDFEIPCNIITYYYEYYNNLNFY